MANFRRIGSGLLLTAALSNAMIPSLSAQQLDTDLLKRIQTQAAGTTTSQESPVDRARTRSDRDQQNSDTSSGPLSDDLQDQLDAVRLRRQLDKTQQPTPVEKDFRDRTNNQGLRQFGYDLFGGSRSSTTQPVTGDVGDAYILGVGDELVVTFQGSTSRSLTTRIDREGRLVVDQIRPIVAAGRSLGSVRRDVEAATRATLLGTDVYLSIGAVRAVTVIVGGEVNRAGSFTVTSLTDVAAVLSRAGGIRQNGSLRRIRVVRGNQSLTYDLYGLLGIGSAPSMRLRDGDRVVVPSIGAVLAVTGGVARPAIYELPQGGSVTISQALAMAGGPLRPRGNDFVVSRIGRNGDEQFMTLSNPSARLQAGDAVIVNPRVRAAEGRMTLSGFVDSPGVRSVGAAPTIGALIGGSDNLKPGSYLPMAVLVRADGVTRARQFRAVNLVNILNKGQDVQLRSDDKLFIFSDSDISFLQSDAVRRIILGAPSEGKCTALDDLQNLVRDTDLQRFAAVIRGTFIVDRNGKAEVAGGLGAQTQFGIRDADALSQENSNLQKNSQLKRNLKNGQADTVENATVEPQKTALKSDKEEDEAQLSPEKLKRKNLACPKIFVDDPDLMTFLLEHSVSISGAVRRPGAYPMAGQVDLSTIVSVTQGMTVDAMRNEVEVTRYSQATEQPRAILLDVSNTKFADVHLFAGDDIRYLSRPQTQEAGAVLLSGEFVRPGLYSVSKGEKLSAIIARAGGLSASAYPYGAVFTRRSVKAAQQEGFKRASRELSASVLTLSARRNVSADAIVAAQELATSVGSVEAPGRVVVEADPRVLERRLDLDIAIEAGDAIYMPKLPNFVLSIGDVLNPTALQFVPNKSVTAYLREAGGFQASADKKHVYIVYPNGIAQPLHLSSWRSSQPVLPPGSAIVVPKNVDPLARIDLVKDLAQIIGQLAVSFASIAVISK
jgi:polysaccharide biosynthesis/export protein